MYTTVSYDNLDTYLAGLAANTQDTPYEIEISPVTEAFLHGGLPASQGTLQYVLQHNSTKYVSLKFEAPAELITAYSMLNGCTALISVDISGMTRVTDTYGMFKDCIYLASVILPNMASVTRAHSMFESCLSLTSVDVSGMSRVTDTHTMFGNCNNLASVILPTMEGVTDASGMFALCYSLTTIDVSGMTSVTDASSMFQDCGFLTSVDVSGMTSARNTRWMFSTCSSLENISLPTMTNVSQAGSMFKNCTRLTEIHGWSVPPTADMTDCFSGCTALEAIYVPEPSPSESSWRAWDIRKDTANNQSTVTVYNPDGTSNSVSVPSAGTYTMKVTDKVDEFLFSPSEGIPAATIQKMLQTKAPITAKDALDPTRDNFALLAKDRSSARTNVTTDVIEEGNKLPPTSEAVRAAIGSVVPVESVNYEMVEKEVGTFFGKKLYEKSFIIRENGVNSSNWSGSPGVAPTFTYNGIEMDNWSEVVDYSLICISSDKKSMIKIDCYIGGVFGTDWPYGARIRNIGKSVNIAIRDNYSEYMPNIYIKYFYLKND